jgi:hypothetical protein
MMTVCQVFSNLAYRDIIGRTNRGQEGYPHPCNAIHFRHVA